MGNHGNRPQKIRSSNNMKRKRYSINERTGEIAIGEGESVLVEPFMQFRIDGDRWMTSEFKARKLSKGCEYSCTWTLRVT